ncbi:DUF4837 family protein [Carboxylicivirga sediminis]|uniref:DUF4837 family protein n=1 Tax=Carboxylicivirga sediminis TaxID=2006564 RepID=A0A941IZ23_9BACT|nr:DUF4837 family protein [Carboxylicivirga sediminis]MBR8537178.1 DUF4837 family protein [Carboxylicivirga sediminis]
MKNYMNNISNRIWLLAITVVVSIIIVAACADEPTTFKTRAIGSPGELLVVVEDKYWEADEGQYLKAILKDEFPALPQEETMFKKTRINYEQFKRHFRTYRNIMLVSVRPQEVVNRVEYRKHEWAINQYVAEVIVRSPVDLKSLLKQKWPTMKGFFYGGDIQSMADSYINLYQPEAVSHIKSNYPFTIYFPKGFKLKKNKGQFSWLDTQRLGSQLGIFVYQCPLDSLGEINAQSLLRFRNNLLRKQVPGENRGSFMTTEEQFPVSVNKAKFANRQWIELRGLWKVQGDFMGGPFVDYFYKDTDNNQLLMISGYVYAPAKPKKGIYMREVEAVLKTIHVN